MSLTPGTRLGSYEVVGALGAGGMGEVYRVRDTKLNREVALKVLPAMVADDPDRLARFKREAQVLASLNHPHIAQVHGFEDAAVTHAPLDDARGAVSVSRTALVMELVEGPTLADRIAQGAIPVNEAIAIARQIASALEAAHEKGIIHRDLKPANIKVKEDGTVKVLDFGLAKALDPTGASETDAMNSPTLTARATQLGVILGTAAYMAPEQAKGRTVDKRADIWAFGVVLFEMLTGRRAFDGEDASDVLAAVLRQEIDWSALPKDVTPELRRLLQRCLERDPKRRLRDIGDAFAELDAPVQRQAAVAPLATPRSSTLARVLPWAAAVVIAGGAVAWAMLRTPPSEAHAVIRAEAKSKDPTMFATISRDGTKLAYNVVGGPNSGRLFLRMMDQFDGKAVAGGEGAAAPLFSPDGQWIAYNTSDLPRRIRRMPVTGGTSSPVCEGDFFFGGAWGEDDTIVFASPKGLVRVPATGGATESLTTPDAQKRELAHVRPQFLPGGTQLLFTINFADRAEFAVLDLATKKFRIVGNGGDNGKYVASGHLTYVRSGTLFAVPFDLRKLETTGPEVPVVEGVSTAGPTYMADYSVSDTGLLAYMKVTSTAQGTTLAWADRTGATKVLPGQSRQQWGTGRLSPDGTHVINSIQDGRGGQDIWSLDVERGTPTRLTFGGVNDFPIWSPDGRRVVYGSQSDAKYGVWSVLADASGKPTLIGNTDSSPSPTSFAPDGRSLLYSALGPDKKRMIFVMPIPAAGGTVATSHPLHDVAASEGEGQISPDGRWVAYLSAESGAPDLYVQPFPGPGAKVRISTQSASRPRWSHDGRQLYYWMFTPGARLMAVDVSAGPNVTFGAPHELFTLVTGTTWDPAPKGDRFLVELVAGDEGSTIATVTNWFDELKRRAPAKK